MEGFRSRKEASKSPETGETFGHKAYEIEGGKKVEIAWNIFPAPSAEEAVSHEEETEHPTVVFLPGWGIDAHSASVRELSSAFAKSSHAPSISIASNSEKREGEDYLYNEARAISSFIKEQNAKHVILAGHSQGGDKAINVIQLLQDDPEMKIDGLILMNSMGLYEQSPGKLAKGFAADSLLSTPGTILKTAHKKPDLLKKGMRVSTDVLSSMLRNFKDSPRKYAATLKEEVKGMARINPRLAELTVPVVLISSTEDPISHPEKILPSEHEQRIREEQTGEGYQDPREEFLKKQIFPNSPYVRMLKPRKLGNHGMPFFRPEPVARASLYLLERHARKSKEV